MEGNFTDFFGANVRAGEGFYKPQPQFVDAAEEVTTEQPQTQPQTQGAFNRAPPQLLEGER